MDRHLSKQLAQVEAALNSLSEAIENDSESPQSLGNGLRIEDLGYTAFSQFRSSLLQLLRTPLHHPHRPALPSGSSSEAETPTIRDLHTRVQGRPYSIPVRLHLAHTYLVEGYPDLAVGEAYKALLLVDEAGDESGEYHELATAALRSDIFGIGGEYEKKQMGDEEDEDEITEQAIKLYSLASYTLLLTSVLILPCPQTALSQSLIASNSHPSCAPLASIVKNLRTLTNIHNPTSSNSTLIVNTASQDPNTERAMVRRELYPWNTHEAERFSDDALEFLNQKLREVAGGLVEVRVTELPVLGTGGTPTQKITKQLGLFATRDLAPGTLLLDEPSLLTASSRLHDTFCDACGISISITSTTEPTPCPSCDDTLFCSPTCLELAQNSYHPSLCNCALDAVARDAPPAQAADALYTLLVLRVLAMAETQGVHPLDLGEVRFLWGDYTNLGDSESHNGGEDESRAEKLCHANGSGGKSHITSTTAAPAKTLPWTFASANLTPLHALEKMDVNIFDDGGRYAPWVLNTLFAKFRGVASARQGSDGRPEVGAVHPLWCLANHSCDPNVRWKWEGRMRFWVRGAGERVVWKGGREGNSEAGLKKGEEVLSHYCDVELDVDERREWAAGALGGMCMCERCIWEKARQGDGAVGK
ncbi:hypothetical protein K402DRAFT_388476 [Aulographum hederae CBS 113979]|uniref:SET domain-containing protein n=1 Tax=Aulographum hederae CBS 113979 TaxID=1176131 RepID=A0A6G1HFU5_9PEZI|nr:hypothetical protein K402DRAFT_388476 [Aulographum hederae CBS 113979]